MDIVVAQQYDTSTRSKRALTLYFFRHLDDALTLLDDDGSVSSSQNSSVWIDASAPTAVVTYDPHFAEFSLAMTNRHQPYLMGSLSGD
jgi:hypothetical protein